MSTDSHIPVAPRRSLTDKRSSCPQNRPWPAGPCWSLFLAIVRNARCLTLAHFGKLALSKLYLTDPGHLDCGHGETAYPTACGRLPSCRQHHHCVPAASQTATARRCAHTPLSPGPSSKAAGACWSGASRDLPALQSRVPAKLGIL